MNGLFLTVCAFALVVLFLICFSSTRKRPDHFGAEDQNYAIAALEDLQSDLHGGTIIDVGDRFLERFEMDIIGVATEVDSSGNNVGGKLREHLTFAEPIDTRNWPYYHYSYPYRYAEGGAWPPNMSSRLYNWEPGFQTSGWSYWMRPGITFNKWPRNRWVRNNNSYYYINNGKDRTEDFYKGT